MGGSASWRNVRSLLKNNIPDINIIEQDQIDYPRLDVWGISDNNLFKVAQETFENSNSSNPFFAIIQIPYLVAIFLLATVLRLPLRVRALFLVLCPRTGKPIR